MHEKREKRVVDLLLPFLRSPLTPTTDQEFLNILLKEFSDTAIGKKVMARETPLSTLLVTWFQYMEYAVDCMNTCPPSFYYELKELVTKMAKQKGLRLG